MVEKVAVFSNQIQEGKMSLAIELYTKLYLLRRCELAIIKHYSQDGMKTPMHMSMGSEAIAVGICHAMTDHDCVLGTYRSHALYLAKTGDIQTFFAEMYGKKSGCSKGKSGSMHLCGPDKGHLGSSAIVGSNVPVGVGSAFSHKYLGRDNVSATFFGDAATDEGSFWESLNVACLMQLPVIFVCENNGLAVHTTNKDRRGYKSVNKIVEQYNCHAVESIATNVEDVYLIACNAIQMAKRNIPVFLHLKYYRYLEHVGVSEDFNEGYRDKVEYDEWIKQDPINTQRERLRQSGCSENMLSKLETDIDSRVMDAVKFAQEEPFCDEHEVMRDVFYGNA